MIAYIDSSVLIRILLKHPNALREWSDVIIGVASTLLSVECCRALDQLRHRGEIDGAEVDDKRHTLTTFLTRLETLPLNSRVLEIASRPLPTSLATLDAIHLATALVYRESQPADERPVVFATHDRALAKAASALKFDVLGL